MLTLKREKNQRIVVIPPDSGPVTVTVVEIVGGVVRLGFQADADTRVYRVEVWKAIQRDGHEKPRRAR